jgi:hypothetical protein
MYKHIGLVEGKVVVAAVPDDNIGFFFGYFQDAGIVYTGVDDDAAKDMGFILFPLFDGALVQSRSA